MCSTNRSTGEYNFSFDKPLQRVFEWPRQALIALISKMFNFKFKAISCDSFANWYHNFCETKQRCIGGQNGKLNGRRNDKKLHPGRWTLATEQATGRIRKWRKIPSHWTKKFKERWVFPKPEQKKTVIKVCIISRALIFSRNKFHLAWNFDFLFLIRSSLGTQILESLRSMNVWMLRRRKRWKI